MDFDWTYDQPGYDAGNLDQYEAMSGDQGGFGYDWANDMTGMGFADLTSQPQSIDTNLVEEPQGPYGFNQSLVSEPQAPSIGQGGPTPQGQDDWWNQVKKAGMGMGVGLATNAAGAGLQALLNPAQKQQSMPQLATRPGAQYTPQPLENTPGTKASPLISGRPTQVIGSQGLKGKRAPSYGGFSMY